MSEEVLWVGVSFDPTDESEYAGGQHDIVVGTLCEPALQARVVTERFPSGAQIDVYPGSAMTLVDVFNATHTRIGFGIRVNSIAEGRMKILGAGIFLRGLGITLPVSVWAWSPASVPSSIVRPAGVEQMLSLDLE